MDIFKENTVINKFDELKQALLLFSVQTKHIAEMSENDCKLIASLLEELKAIKESAVFYSNRPIEDIVLEARADAIEEIMTKAKKIQLEQIECLNQSTRRNGKMWAIYMNTYLGHIQVACKRMLE